MKLYCEDVERALEQAKSSRAGLTSAEAQQRLAANGKNRLAEAKKDSLIKRFFMQMADPMILILLAAALVSGVLAVVEGESFADVIIILAVVLINAVLGVYQENKAERAIEALQEMSAATSKALRDGKVQIVRSEELVVGDVVLLEAGDAVPADGRLIECRQKDPQLGYVGEITKVHISPVTDLLEKGYIPVVSTLGCDRGGNVYNINGDTAAAYIAGALGAERFVLMTDIAGLMRDKDDPATLIPEVSLEEIDALLKQGVISGGMIPKVSCCVEAIREGVKKVVIMDGRVPHAILMELLTNEGAGTLVRE